MPARRISLVNFKGGVGKTSITVNLAASLARELDQKVLVVDMDAQSNTSIWLLGVPRWNNLNGMDEKSVWGLFHPDNTGLKQCIEEEVLLNDQGVELIPNLDIIPATYKLMDLEHEYQDSDSSPYFVKFRMQLEILFDQYDYILFDCPPNVFRATRCAVFSSEEIYVPANPDLLSFVGLSLLSDKIAKFHSQTTLNRKHFPGFRPAEIRGIILNAVETGADYRQILGMMSAKIVNLRSRQVISPDADILPTRIRRTVTAAKTQLDALPATLGSGSAGLREDYLNLARYIHNTPLGKKGARYGKKYA
jgi:chromosome partitioning protein